MSPSQTPASRLVLALAQIDCTVGDVAGNAARVRAARQEARAQGADLVMFSELFLSGYPPEDLVLKPAFLEACRSALEDLARETADGGPALLLGAPWAEDGRRYNAYALLDGGRIEAVRSSESTAANTAFRKPFAARWLLCLYQLKASFNSASASGRIRTTKAVTAN